MILQGRNLTQGLTGADVGALHGELTALGYTIPTAELQGKSIRRGDAGGASAGTRSGRRGDERSCRRRDRRCDCGAG